MDVVPHETHMLVTVKTEKVQCVESQQHESGAVIGALLSTDVCGDAYRNNFEVAQATVTYPHSLLGDDSRIAPFRESAMQDFETMKMAIQIEERTEHDNDDEVSVKLW